MLRILPLKYILSSKNYLDCFHSFLLYKMKIFMMSNTLNRKQNSLVILQRPTPRGRFQVIILQPIFIWVKQIYLCLFGFQYDMKKVLLGEADVKQMFSLLQPHSTVNYTVSRYNTNLGLRCFPLLLEANKNKETATKYYTYVSLYF